MSGYNLKNIVLFCLKIFILPLQIHLIVLQHYAAFHLGLHCLQKYPLGVSRIQRCLYTWVLKVIKSAAKRGWCFVIWLPVCVVEEVVKMIRNDSASKRVFVKRRERVVRY